MICDMSKMICDMSKMICPPHAYEFWKWTFICVEDISFLFGGGEDDFVNLSHPRESNIFDFDYT